MQLGGPISITLFLSISIILAGCGGNGPLDGSASSGEHDKLMNEALDLSIKILNETLGRNDVTAVNTEYEKQIAELNTRIAKLPKLADEEILKRMQSLGGKYREIDEKTSAIALKGPLPKLPNYTLYTEE